MAITAFSKMFKRELDVKQFQNLYQQFPNELDLSDFTKNDIQYHFLLESVHLLHSKQKQS